MNVRRFDLLQFQQDRASRAKVSLGGSGVAPLPVDELDATLPATFGDAAEADLARAIAEARAVPVSSVLPAVGGSEALLVCFLALVEPGSRVLVESPTYFPLEEIPRVLGARVTHVPRAPHDGWRLDVDAILAQLGPDVSVVALTSPNNPTSRVTPAADLARLAEACERVGAWLLVDHTFAALAHPRPPPSHTLHPRIVSTETLTKCHGLPGLRAGWILASPEARQRMHRARGITSIIGPSLCVPYAIAALRDEHRLLARARGIVASNQAGFRAFLAAHPRLAWTPGEGILTGAVRLPQGEDDVKHAESLLDAEGVLLVPGSYLRLPGHVRIGFGAPPARFQEGLEGWARFLGG